MRRWVDAATLAKAKGSQGRFVARCAAGLSFMPQEGAEVAFVPPQLDAPRRALAADVLPLDARSFEISFQGIDDRETAERLLGCHCLVERAVFEDGANRTDRMDVVGYAVREQGIDLGFVAAVVENPAQWLLEVRRKDADRPLLVPYVDEIVMRVDHEAQAIDVALPAGLLDL